jgi:hypothetical protein
MGSVSALFDTLNHGRHRAGALMAIVVVVQLQRFADVELELAKLACRSRVIACDKVLVGLPVLRLRAFPAYRTAVGVFVVDGNAAFVQARGVAQSDAAVDSAAVGIFLDRNGVVEVARAEAAVAEILRVHLLTLAVLLALELACRQLLHLVVLRERKVNCNKSRLSGVWHGFTAYGVDGTAVLLVILAHALSRWVVTLEELGTVDVSANEGGWLVFATTAEAGTAACARQLLLLEILAVFIGLVLEVALAVVSRADVQAFVAGLNLIFNISQ